MSDSIKKYNELVEEGKIDPSQTYEDRRENEILRLLAKAVKADKIAEVETRAAEVQKEYGTTSLLLGLQIATDEILDD